MPVGLIRCENMDKRIRNLMNSDSDVQRRRRYKQMDMEETAANKLRDDGWEILSPTVVCDRIGIKDGEVFFIEFKKPGQKLSPNQERIRALVEKYIISYY